MTAPTGTSFNEKACSASLNASDIQKESSFEEICSDNLLFKIARYFLRFVAVTVIFELTLLFLRHSQHSLLEP